MSTLLDLRSPDLDIEANGVTREWRIGVGDMAREHFALRFSATRLGAIRRLNAVARSYPDAIVALHFVVDAESGKTASKALKTAYPKARAA